ncbi:hypothetical protein BDV23DRAFT_183775 [Aspergillus alliaceus]|uniref:Uncharacterized protein n=1 Tax=Petromyces alliaceus TaxID=209559 RepID=A0A5N7C8G5_PETAA|nr:hypothetical protein BDV23DRAFT_183775 [Aspergillus alliaceus]
MAKEEPKPKLYGFRLGIRDDNRPQFASGMLLFVIALAHGAFFNIKSLDNLTQYDLREGPTTEVPQVLDVVVGPRSLPQN